MKTTIKSLLVLALAGFVFTGCATHRCCKSQQLEYKFIAITDEDVNARVNDLVGQGWKLEKADHQEHGYNLIFVRPKQ